MQVKSKITFFLENFANLQIIVTAKPSGALFSCSTSKNRSISPKCCTKQKISASNSLGDIQVSHFTVQSEDGVLQLVSVITAKASTMSLSYKVGGIS